MSNLVVEINVENNTIVERDFSQEELAIHEAMQAEEAQLQAEAQAKLNAKASALAKLAALGLTEEEVAAL